MPNYTKLLQKVMPQVTRFPSGQPFMKMGQRGPVIGRFDENELGHDHIAWLRSEGWMPMQGPDLPLEPYLAWKAMKRDDNPIYRRWAFDDYRRALESDRPRQNYNRKVSAWNEYTDMSPRERAFWDNRQQLARALDDYDLPQDPEWYTRNYENFQYVPKSPALKDMDIGQARSIDPEDYQYPENFDEFGWDLADAPWRY